MAILRDALVKNMDICQATPLSPFFVSEMDNLLS